MIWIALGVIGFSAVIITIFYWIVRLDMRRIGREDYFTGKQKDGH